MIQAQNTNLTPRGESTTRLLWQILKATILTIALLDILLLFYNIDEREHWYVAALMYKLGLRPFIDFMEHHSPLFWQMLGLYFKFGGEPHPIYPFIFGRILVAVLVWGTLILVGILAAKFKPKEELPISFLLLLVSLLNLRATLVARPEVPGMFALFASVVLMPHKADSAPNRVLTRGLVAGLLLAVALHMSPRFVWTFPALLWFLYFYGKPNTRARFFGATALSTVLFVILFAMPYLPHIYYWTIKFNSAVWQVNTELKALRHPVVLKNIAIGFVPAALFLTVFLTSAAFGKIKPALYSAVPVVFTIGIACVFTAPLYYQSSQNFVPLAIAATLVVLPLEKTLLDKWKNLLRIALSVLAVLLALAHWQGGYDIDGAFDKLFGRHERLAILTPKDETAFLCPDLDYPMRKVERPKFYYQFRPPMALWRIRAALNLATQQGTWAPKPDFEAELLDKKPYWIDITCLNLPKQRLTQFVSKLKGEYVLYRLPVFETGQTAILLKRITQAQ